MCDVCKAFSRPCALPFKWLQSSMWLPEAEIWAAANRRPISLRGHVIRSSHAVILWAKCRFKVETHFLGSYEHVKVEKVPIFPRILLWSVYLNIDLFLPDVNVGLDTGEYRISWHAAKGTPPDPPRSWIAPNIAPVTKIGTEKAYFLVDFRPWPISTYQNSGP